MKTSTAALIAVLDPGGPAINDVAEICTFPTAAQIMLATSLHVFAYSSTAELILVESEGEFDAEVWDRVAVVAEAVCRGGEVAGGDAGRGLEGWLRGIVGEEIGRAGRWRGNL